MDEMKKKQAELVERGHSILDNAPRDYSAITRLIEDALAYGWEVGSGMGFHEAVECYVDGTRDPENPKDAIPNPFEKEEN